jgi:hypothetical protein
LTAPLLIQEGWRSERRGGYQIIRRELCPRVKMWKLQAVSETYGTEIEMWGRFANRPDALSKTPSGGGGHRRALGALVLLLAPPAGLRWRAPARAPPAVEVE